MSHVDFKKSQYPMLLNRPCPMSPLDTIMLHVDFRKWSMSCPLFIFSCH